MEPATTGCSTAAGLVARIRAGARGAEEELVSRFSRGIAIILHRAGADFVTVEDLRQETFRLGLTKIRKDDPRDPERLAGFLAGLARNLALAHFRRARATAGTVDMGDVGELPSAAPGALEVLLKREQAEIARNVLREMAPERDREVLQRFYVAEDDKDQICADLGLGRLQFNHVLFRARRRYRELWERASLGTKRPARVSALTG